MTHGHVADNITIFGNKAYVSGGECDLEVDTYKYNRETGANTGDGSDLNGDISIIAFQLDNLGVWGQRHTTHTVNVALVDCDGKDIAGKANPQRVYISGTSGQNMIGVTDCDFKTANTAVYSNADGKVTVCYCTFEGSKAPVNINHKANGTMSVDVQDCTFTNCGDAGDWKQFAAPVRFVNSGNGTMKTGVQRTTFTDTVGTNGDILLGDGRTGEKSNDVSMYVSGTDANIQAQKPGYYNGNTTDANKKAATEVKSNETLDTSVETLLPAELTNYATVELTFGSNVSAEDIAAAMAMYKGKQYETCKAANEAYMALFGVTWEKGYLDVTDTNAPLYKYAGVSGSVAEVKYYIHGTMAGFTSLQSSGNQIDCTVGGNHQIFRTSVSIIGVNDANGNKAKLTDGNVQAYVAGGYESMFTASGKLTIDNIEFTTTTSTTVGASAATGTNGSSKKATGEMEIKNCKFNGRLYVYDNFDNTGMTYNIHDNVFDGTHYSGDGNAYAIFAQCKGGNKLIIEKNTISGFARGINIDHANVTATIKGNTISITDKNRSCIQLSSLTKAEITGNTLNLTGGNAFTLHSKLAEGSKIVIDGNTVNGIGYLIYDDTKNSIDLTYTNNNKVASTVDTTKGIYNDTTKNLSSAVNAVINGVANDGSEDNPYTLEQLGAMTRAEYITAQTRLGGTMYVTVGDYSYDTNGVLGNGTADNSDKDSTKMNYYGAPGAKSGQYSDAAVGKSIVFVGGSITSGVTGYTSIDNIGTSLLLAVPAYTNVTFKDITFNNVMSFNYQLYTSPWSQLGELKFDNCTFNGIIVGAIAAQTLTFNGCTFTNYTNQKSANSSNPTWIRPAYGNWTQGDNEGQGSDFKSLTTINFTGNTVTSTRPVKFEFISQWNITSTVTATGNYFDISKQDGDDTVKNVGLYLGAHTDANAFNLVAEDNTKSANTAALYTIPEGKTSLPLGSTVKDTNGNEVELTDALKWKAGDAAEDKIVLKTVEAVASVGDAKYASLAAAIAAANNGDTVTLLKDVTENVEIAKEKNLTLDLNGKTLNGGTGTAKAALTNYGTITIQDTSAAKTGTIKRDDTGVVGETSYYVIRNQGTMTIESGTVINNSGYKQASSIGSMNGSSLICNGDCDEGGTLTIKGGTFTQNNFIAIKNGALGVLHVTGGTITSNHSAIQNWFKADITGGEIKGQLWTDAWKEGESVGETKIGGDAKFTGEIVMDITGKVAPTLAINGGNLNVTNWRITSAAAKAGAKPAISGGKFTSAVPENYCAEGFIPTANADGTYGVKQGTYVAETNGVKYETLQAAINAAARNATVTMLADTRENVTINNAMTLDLNGHTLNGGTVKGTPTLKIDTACVTVMDSSEAKTGTIMREDTAENSGVSSHYVIDIQGKNALLTFNSGNVRNNSGNADGSKGASLVRVGDDNNKKVHPVLTIAGGTFTQDNFIVIKVDFGTLHLKGGTVNSKTSYAVENWLNANIKGDAVVNGAVSSWTYSAGSNSTLEISGGTVNGNVESVSYDGAEGKLAKVKITGGTVNGTLSTKRYNNATAPSKDMATIEVTGGTFDRDPTKYVVEGSTVNANSDGTFGVAKAYLAKVGETSYYTMDEAFKAQTASGAPIVMLRDYTTGSTFNSGTVARVVDLRGHTWTCTGTDANSAAFEINNPNATLTVKNGKIVSSQLVGLIPSAMGGTIKYDNSSLTFENVEMSTTATSGIETNGNNTNDTVTLKNSTLNVPNGFGIYFPSSGTLTIDNSTINAKTMGVQVCAGSLSINEGSKITVTGDPVEKTENDGAIQDGAAISIVNRGYKPFGEIAITGGTFTAKAGNNAIKAYNWDNTNKVETTFTANDKVAVSGGTFSSAVPAGLCAEGYVPTEADANGNYTVEKVMVAQIGEVKYGTLAEAIAAANAGDTVKLLRDINTPEISYMISKSLTIDLNGKTVTGDGYDAVFQIDNADAKVLIKNGNIVAVENTGSAGKYAMAIWACKAECEVTLENLNVSQKITHTDDPQMDMIYASGGTIIINSGNFESGTPAWTLNCKDAAYKDGTANIIVKGGTFTGFDPANNKAEGENTNFVAAGYKSVDNNDGTYTVVKNENVVAVIGTKEYATLSEALKDAAKTGGTVLLVADVDANEDLVRVKYNVTLDLNGHSITNADMLYVNGQIKDSASVKGFVSAVDYVINDLNAYTPVYNSAEKGYSFFNLGMNSRWDTTENKAKFALKNTNDRAAAVALMVASADDRRVKAVVTFSWEEQGTIVEQSFTFLDTKLSDYLTTVPANQLYVVVNGLDQFTAHVDMQTKFVIYKENGAELFTLAGESSPVNY